MRSILSFLFVVIILSSNAQVKNPFVNLNFDKVVMYDFVGGKGTDLYIINENGALAKNIKKQVILGKENIGNLNAKLGNRKSYGGSKAFCFDPHLGFVYYFKGKVIAHLTICLDCNQLRSSIDIPAQNQGKAGQGKDIYYILDGLSKSFRSFLNQLLVANNFSHQRGK
jgi:hypothetical protein